ncbi:MAG: polysaccharide biosynthesis tyrosine autokinase [Caldilineales bacterium]|nr:polysaccharide biosynthesis tyrosine autokinase [Caldilineales bacterium]MDW8317767.1 polysaccharide biosynthesis tyrosine autokinase [Anaerolineae bacterium]
MELREYVNLLRKWLWLILVTTVSAAIIAFFVSRGQTPIYQATATVLINQARSPVRGTEYADILTSERVARTYAELLKGWPVLEEAVRKMGFTQEFRELQKAYQLSVSITPIRDTQLINLQVQANDPALAAELANTLPEVFKGVNQARQRERFETTRKELQAELAAVEKDIVATQEAIAQLSESQSAEDKAQVSRLQSALRRYEATYNSLLNSLAELRLTEAQATDNVVLATPAQPPKNPVRPRVLFNTLLAAIVGAMLAVGVAFLIEYLDDTVKTPDDVRAVSGLPTLAAVVELEADTPQQRLVALTAPRSPEAEAYRVLRTNLQFSSLDKPLRALMVTSAGPGEGKSTTATNLAVVFAQAGSRVLLVDADLRRPSIHRLLQVPNNTGLTTALLQVGNRPEDFVQATAQQNLSALTTGPIPPNPAELLGSARMHDLLTHLKERYDLVVVDSPPVLAVADATILSNQADGVLMVVSAGETRFEMLAQALERLTGVGSRPLGVVLNKLTPDSGGSYYYYYYASQYHSGDGADGGAAPPSAGNGKLRRLRSPKPSGQATT